MWKTGDRILIHGWVMLQKIEDGCTYEVYKISSGVLYLAKVLKSGKLSTKNRIGHYVFDIERSMDNRNLNWIEKI